MKPYEKIIEYYKEVDGMDYSRELEAIVMLSDYYINKIKSGRLLKKDKEQLVLLLRLLSES